MLHKLHRASACLIAAFVAAHLFNHLLAVQSINAHIHFMESFRPIYRNGFVETLLLVCVAYQVGSGIYFIKNRWGQRRGFFERLQAISGGYLAYFLIVHVAAVLIGRNALKIDTSFYYAAAGMHVSPFHYYFVPYYFLSVVAIFGHIACAVHWLTRGRLREVYRNSLGYSLLVIGVLMGAVIVAAFAGAFYDIVIPSEYRAVYE